MFAPAVQVKVGAKETPVAKFAGKESVGQVASDDDHAKRIFGRVVVEVAKEVVLAHIPVASA